MNRKPVKTHKKTMQKKPKVVENKEVMFNTPMAEIFPREIKYLKLKDIKRAHSKLIMEFLKGNVKSDEAKTLTYLFTAYIQVINQAETEQRLEAIERKLK